MERNISAYISPYSTVEQNTALVILVATMFCSLYGNTVMLVVLYRNDRMWTSMNLLIGNLSLVSLFITGFCMPFNMISLVASRWPFGEDGVCRLNAFMNSLLMLVTIFTHTMISVDKYFSVVKPLSRTMTLRKAWIIISFAWVLAIAMSFLPLLGFGRFDYNGTTLICGVGFPVIKTDLYYLMLLFSLGFGIPLAIMGHVYLRIFIAVHQHRKRLQATTTSSLEVFDLQKRLIRTVFFSLLCFLVCWVPFCLLVLVSVIYKDKSVLPHGLGLAAYSCGFLNSAFYPMIVCSMSKRFQEGLYSITRWWISLPIKALRTCTRCCLLHEKLSLTPRAEAVLNFKSNGSFEPYFRIIPDDMSTGSPSMIARTSDDGSTDSCYITPSISVDETKGRSATNYSSVSEMKAGNKLSVESMC